MTSTSPDTFRATTASTLQRADAERALVLPTLETGPVVTDDVAARATPAFPAGVARAATVTAKVFSPLTRMLGEVARGHEPAPGDAFEASAAADAAQADPRAHAAGYAAGWAQGVAAAAVHEREALAAHQDAADAHRDELRHAVDQALSALDAAADQMRSRIVPTIDATADVLVASAADLAEVLLGHELADSQTRGRTALARALAAAPEHSDVVVTLHPVDRQLLDAAGVTGATERGRGVALTDDPALTPGDAIAHFAGGQVDARISTAMARLRASLRSARRESAAAAEHGGGGTA